jgi:hypothetical protein
VRAKVVVNNQSPDKGKDPRTSLRPRSDLDIPVLCDSEYFDRLAFSVNIEQLKALERRVNPDNRLLRLPESGSDESKSRALSENDGDALKADISRSLAFEGVKFAFNDAEEENGLVSHALAQTAKTNFHFPMYSQAWGNLAVHLCVDVLFVMLYEKIIFFHKAVRSSGGSIFTYKNQQLVNGCVFHRFSSSAEQEPGQDALTFYGEVFVQATMDNCGVNYAAVRTSNQLLKALLEHDYESPLVVYGVEILNAKNEIQDKNFRLAIAQSETENCNAQQALEKARASCLAFYKENRDRSWGVLLFQIMQHIEGHCNKVWDEKTQLFIANPDVDSPGVLYKNHKVEIKYNGTTETREIPSYYSHCISMELATVLYRDLLKVMTDELVLAEGDALSEAIQWCGNPALSLLIQNTLDHVLFIKTVTLENIKINDHTIYSGIVSDTQNNKLIELKEDINAKNQALVAVIESQISHAPQKILKIIAAHNTMMVAFCDLLKSEEVHSVQHSQQAQNLEHSITQALQDYETAYQSILSTMARSDRRYANLGGLAIGIAAAAVVMVVATVVALLVPMTLPLATILGNAAEVALGVGIVGGVVSKYMIDYWRNQPRRAARETLKDNLNNVKKSIRNSQQFFLESNFSFFQKPSIDDLRDSAEELKEVHIKPQPDYHFSPIDESLVNRSLSKS